jgi:hypothetical protein
MDKLLAIQSELKAPKDLVNKFGGYKYRSCESILEALKPLLKSHGLVLILCDEIVSVGQRIYVKAIASLLNGDKVIAMVTAFAREEETKKGMDGSQITGAASSYARKYALNGLFLIDDNKDSDSTNEHDKGSDAIAEAAAKAKAAYNAGKEATPPRHTDMSPMAPKEGLSATGKVMKHTEPNGGGYVRFAIEGFNTPSGKPAGFSTKNPEYIAMMIECEEKGDKAHIEYDLGEYNGYHTYNITMAEAILDTVPF